MTGAINRSTLCCKITAMGFLLAVMLIFIIPYHMRGPDSWVYYYAAKNFSQGKLIINDQLHRRQLTEAWEQGGRLIQYIRIDDDRWALEKAPGYILFLVPFELAGIPRMANILLALGLVAVTYLLLKRLRDEKAACIGSLLIIFTPVSLIMLQRSYMAMFGASAFLAIGGGLYLYCCLEHNRLKPLVVGLVLFLSALFISWSVVARYTNLIIAAVFAVHFIISRLRTFIQGRRRQVALETIAFSLGVAISLAVILSYHNTVFGSPLTHGYMYTRFPIKFAFQYIGVVDQGGQSIPMRIIKGNLQNMPAAIFIGFPLLVIAIPGIGYILYKRLSGDLCRSTEKPDRWAELPWDILLALIGWIICVYPLYMLYEWTARPVMQGVSFIIVDRFYLPGLFPIVIFTSLIIARFPKKLAIIILIVYIAMGSALYTQSALNGISPLSKPRSTSLERKINQICHEVKNIPTNEQNINQRFDQLYLWARQLRSHGYPVNRVLPKGRLFDILGLMKTGKIPRAARQIDQLYRDVEKMVAK